MTDETQAGLLEQRAAQEIRKWASMALPAGLHLVATPIGNLGDITLRALAVLAAADVVCCEDTRHSRALLAHFGISRPLISLHEHNEATESDRIAALIGEGKSVALISDAGTPLLSDPGYRLTRAVIEAGHHVHAVPGPSALLAALTVSGLPTDTVVFAGFPPPRQAARRGRLRELLALPATLVLYESPSRIHDLLAEIAEQVPDRPIAIARELTKRFEEVRRGTAADLLAGASDGSIRGEIVVLVAPPGPRSITDEEIGKALEPALMTMRLSEAARSVADQLGVPRTRVYEIGLKVRGGKVGP